MAHLRACGARLALARLLPRQIHAAARGCGSQPQHRHAHAHAQVPGQPGCGVPFRGYASKASEGGVAESAAEIASARAASELDDVLDDIKHDLKKKKAELDDADAKPAVPAELTFMDKVAKNLGWLGGFYSRRQVIMRSARRTYLSTAEHSAGEEIYRICRLPDTFQSWFLVQQLHLWMTLVRLQSEGSDGKTYHKQLIQYFWEDVEYRMRLMKVDDRNIQAETTRELLHMFYGLVVAYDEGLSQGDDVLAAAVWRNLFHASRATATAQDLALMVEYIRREVKALDAVDSEHLMNRGGVSFGPMPSVLPRPEAGPAKPE